MTPIHSVMDPDPVGSGTLGSSQIQIKMNCTEFRSDLLKICTYYFGKLSSKWSNSSLVTYRTYYLRKSLKFFKSLVAVPLCTLKVYDTNYRLKLARLKG